MNPIRKAVSSYLQSGLPKHIPKRAIDAYEFFSQKGNTLLVIRQLRVERNTTMREPVEMPVAIVREGRLIYDNLMKVGKSEPWVRETLSQLQIYDIRDVRYAMLDQSGAVHVLFS
jgi:hypothetical protein